VRLRPRSPRRTAQPAVAADERPRISSIEGRCAFPKRTPLEPSLAPDVRSAQFVRRAPYGFGVSGAPTNDLVARSDAILERERASLIARVDDLSRRVALHRELLEQLEVELASEQRLLREVEELSDRSPQLRLERLDRQLRGRRLQELAVEVLRRRLGPGQAIHYREWFALLRAEGYEVAGRDPLNTFLTGVGRAENVERVGRRSGLYRLRTPA
jgi:hypothetical protein